MPGLGIGPFYVYDTLDNLIYFNVHNCIYVNFQC